MRFDRTFYPVVKIGLTLECRLRTCGECVTKTSREPFECPVDGNGDKFEIITHTLYNNYRRIFFSSREKGMIQICQVNMNEKGLRNKCNNYQLAPRHSVPGV